MFSITDDTVFENYPKMSHFLNGLLEFWNPNSPQNVLKIGVQILKINSKYFLMRLFGVIFKHCGWLQSLKKFSHSLNDTTYFISFEFWIMTSISGRLEWIEKRLFHLRQKNTTAIVTQYCTFHSVWKMGNFQTLCTICMTTFLAKL